MAHGDQVKARIIAAGLSHWSECDGAVSVRALARIVGMNHASLLYHFKSRAALCDAIACEAVRTRDPRILPRLIVSGHPAAASLSADDRRRALAGC